MQRRRGEIAEYHYAARFVHEVEIQVADRRFVGRAGRRCHGGGPDGQFYGHFRPCDRFAVGNAAPAKSEGEQNEYGLFHRDL